MLVALLDHDSNVVSEWQEAEVTFDAGSVRFDRTLAFDLDEPVLVRGVRLVDDPMHPVDVPFGVSIHAAAHSRLQL